jgi:site-specific DNA-methyltransferase (adenine-specific)
MDYFAGSGTTGIAAITHGRNAILVDNNPQSLEVMCKRFDPTTTKFLNWDCTPVESGEVTQIELTPEPTN